MTAAPVQLVNLSELDPAWQWLKAPLAGQFPLWRHFSSQGRAWAPGPFREPSARLAATRAAVAAVNTHPGPSVLVAHGPRPAAYWAHFGARACKPCPVLAYSFNFTALPSGWQRKAYARALRKVDQFVVASSLEQRLYSGHFGIDPQLLHLQLWGMQPPVVETAKPMVNGTYICALGSQARDYPCLIAAMRKLPSLRLVVVATPESLRHCGVMPENVTVLCNIPRAAAVNVLAHSQFMVLPMQSEAVPCGHVTAVQALHLGVPILATQTDGLSDYLRDEDTARLVPVAAPAALARGITEMIDNPLLRERLAHAGMAFARAHCSEEAVTAFVRQLLAPPASGRAGGTA